VGALEARGLRGWYDDKALRVVRNLVYSGEVPEGSRVPIAVEPLVARELQLEAIAAVEARGRKGAAGAAQPRALLVKLRCGHPDCPGAGTWPMYRVRLRNGTESYRCTGRGPQRRGCGNPLVPLADCDALVLSMTEHWKGVDLASMDLDGRRAYLATRVIAAWRDEGRRVCVTVDGALARRGGASAVTRQA
jgi:hypothetical protein